MRDLTQYRISISKERLEDAKTLLELESFKGSINRSYYSIFSAVRALLAEEEVDFKKHSALDIFGNTISKRKSLMLNSPNTLERLSKLGITATMKIFSLFQKRRQRFNITMPWNSTKR